MTATVEETDWTTLFDLESETPCCKKDCDNTAEWSLVNVCCGALFPVCDQHKKSAENLVENGLLNFSRCRSCKTYPVPDVRFERL